MNEARLRVGIVGCGYQGGRLAEAIGLTDSLVVTACADPDDQAVAILAQQARARHHSRFGGRPA